MLRSMLHTDCITNSAAQFYRMQQSERGDLLNHQAPVGMVVMDLLRAIGMPDNAIHMVLGVDWLDLCGASIVDGPEPMKCAICEAPATNMVQTQGGPRAVCAHCADEAQAVGLKIIL